VRKNCRNVKKTTSKVIFISCSVTGCENWALSRADESKIESAGMGFISTREQKGGLDKRYKYYATVECMGSKKSNKYKLVPKNVQI
jgi:hypothetical protein